MVNVNLPLVAVAVRVAIALLTRTFFQPDEFFQSLEVAHHAVYGYGHLTWEWLAPRPIRSVLYPALNVPIYWLLKVLALDQTAALVGHLRLRSRRERRRACVCGTQLIFVRRFGRRRCSTAAWPR